MFEANELMFIGYIDLKYLDNLNDRKISSGYACKLGGGAISWACKKKICASRSIMEAKFVASSLATIEAV